MSATKWYPDRRVSCHSESGPTSTGRSAARRVSASIIRKIDAKYSSAGITAMMSTCR